MTTDIAIQKPNSLDMIFGNTGDLKAFAQRIRIMMRGGEKLKDTEAIALAQFATVTHLNPFIGECWYIPGSGPMVGIAGARRMDQENAAGRGGHSFPILTVVDAREAGAAESEEKDVAAAFKCEITDSLATAEYQKLFVATLQSLRDTGVTDPVAVAREICGPRPVWVGYGFAKKSESTRMSKVQAARKRAEADALKKRVVIPFGANMADTDVNPEYIEGTSVDMTTEDGEQKPASMSYDDARQVIVKTSLGEKFLSELTIDQLNHVIEKSKIQLTVEAAAIVLRHDFNMDPTDEPRTREENLQQLGFGS